MLVIHTFAKCEKYKKTNAAFDKPRLPIRRHVNLPHKDSVRIRLSYKAFSLKTLPCHSSFFIVVTGPDKASYL